MSTDERRASKDGKIASLILVPIGIAIVFSCLRFFAETSDIPKEAEYLQVLNALEQNQFDLKNDRLTIVPAWSLRPLTVLKKFPWISGDGLAQRPLDRYKRLFVLAEPDGGDALGPLLERFPGSKIALSTDRLTLHTLRTDSARVTYDFMEGLASAEIFLKTNAGGEVPCDRKLKNGFQCVGRKGWQRVTRERLLVSENGRQVMWAHPPVAGEVMTIRYNNVPLGDEIVLQAGHTRSGSKAKAPVLVDIAVNQQKVASIIREPLFDFATEIVDTSSHQGQTGTVEFRLYTQNNSQNHFAFDAYARQSVQ